ncbi:hypothetical protein D3C85_1237090 [compost metagenome]
MCELGDAIGLPAGRVHHQDDAFGTRVIHRRGEVLRQYVERGRTGQRGEQVRVAKDRASDRHQRHVAALSDRAAVLQRPTLAGLDGLGAFMFAPGDGGDGVEHVRGDGPGFTRHQIKRRHPMHGGCVGGFIGHG